MLEIFCSSFIFGSRQYLQQSWKKNINMMLQDMGIKRQRSPGMILISNKGYILIIQYSYFYHDIPSICYAGVCS